MFENLTYTELLQLRDKLTRGADNFWDHVKMYTDPNDRFMYWELDRLIIEVNDQMYSLEQSYNRS